MSPSSCRICGARPRASFRAREMMFGLRDEFTYDECGDCGCLQLRDAAADPTRYYPPGYYSLLPSATRRRPLREFVRLTRNALMYRTPHWLARTLARLIPGLPYQAHEWLARTGTDTRARILDVGSGVGFLVRDLGEVGFRGAIGIDPFLPAPVEYPSGVRVLRQTIHETAGPWDLIMFHHALEHIPQQLDTLRRAAALLAPGGWCLVRVPIASSYAWRHYRENWVQLDAPRHHVLHTVDSLRLAGHAAGLQLMHVQHDSTALQFWGSEAYRRDIPLSHAPSLFTAAEMRRFRRRARELNERGEGDQACFYFQASAIAAGAGEAPATHPGTR